MNKLLKICTELAELAKRNHYHCDDSWYSCPKAEGGCANDSEGDDCNCGADEHNAKVDALLATAMSQSTPTEEDLPMPNDLSHLSEEEFLALSPQGEHAPGPAEPENLTSSGQRLTVQQIHDLPEHWDNYICEYSSNEVQLDGIFTRAQLRQLADFVPSEKGQ